MVKKYPGESLSWINLGTAKIWLKELSDAETCFRKSKEVNPKDPVTYIFLGKLYLSMKKYSFAEREFMDAININPMSFEAVESLLNMHSTGLLSDESLSHLRKVAGLRWCRVFSNMGLLSILEKRTEEACKYFRWASTLSPNNPQVVLDVKLAELKCRKERILLPVVEEIISRSVEKA